MLRIKFQALPFDWAPGKGVRELGRELPSGLSGAAYRTFSPGFRGPRLLKVFARAPPSPPGMPLSGKNPDLAFRSTLIAVSLCEFGQATNPIGPDFLTQIIPEVPERGSPTLDQSKKTAKFLKQTALRSHL